jgi:cytochrome c556
MLPVLIPDLGAMRRQAGGVEGETGLNQLIPRQSRITISRRQDVKTRFIVTAALAVLLSGGLALQVVAQDPAEIIKKRQDAMKANGGDMKAINEFLEKDVGTADDVKAKAASIKEHSALIVDLFPAGTGMDDGKTGAKKEIWEKPDEFKAAADSLGDLAGKLEVAAATGDKQEIADAFGALGKNGCGGCHQTFRQKLD